MTGDSLLYRSHCYTLHWESNPRFLNRKSDDITPSYVT